MTGGGLTLLLSAIVALALLAKRLKIPYPIVLVLGGLVLALIPRMPVVELRPDLVFLLFLPALIFGDGWTTDYRAFKRLYQPIFMLAIGLVVFTSFAVAYVAHAMMGFPLALGFVLGAILSPTDAVAADAIAEEVGLPSRMRTIIGGESLVNDATGLVLYRFAVVAVATGSFSLVAAAGQFVYVALAGVGVGLIVAWVIAKIMIGIRVLGLSDELIAVSISLVTPFALYVPADAIGASGVLAAMSGGMYLSRKSAQIFGPDERIATANVWNLLFFVFNGAAFVLIGLQLRSIVRGLDQHSFLTTTGWGVAIAFVVIVVRIAWIFPGTYVRRWVWPKIREREGPDPPWTAVLVAGMAGMRGIVSLAAALALPDRVAGGAPFPQRNLILFITFVVILVTLVGEGLAMPWLIRRFRIGAAEDTSGTASAARVRLAEAALERLRSLESAFATPLEWEVAGRIQAEYEERIAHFKAHLEGIDPEEDQHQHDVARRLWREARAAERAALNELRRQGQITDDLYREIQWDIDLAEARSVKEAHARS
ncbi:MAG TPA: Na+/H+ antiporter [Candidatus Acidoferrum sp.]|nr:Na+/H+ antiporter [Candidatus Acidoferrum sp.]